MGAVLERTQGYGIMVHKKDDIKAGEYGTFMFPEDNFNGYWRIQTDNPAIRSKMRKIARDNKSPWTRVGWGTSDLFRRTFTRKPTALAFFTKLGLECGFGVVQPNKTTWELRKR
jgi:hypothetical protein